MNSAHGAPGFPPSPWTLAVQCVKTVSSRVTSTFHIFGCHLQAYFMLDEMMLAGELQEPSKKAVTRVIEAQDQLVSPPPCLAANLSAAQRSVRSSCTTCPVTAVTKPADGSYAAAQVENAKQGGAPTAVAGLSGIAVDRSRAYS